MSHPCTWSDVFRKNLALCGTHGAFRPFRQCFEDFNANSYGLKNAKLFKNFEYFSILQIMTTCIEISFVTPKYTSQHTCLGYHSTSTLPLSGRCKLSLQHSEGVLAKSLSMAI